MPIIKRFRERQLHHWLGGYVEHTLERWAKPEAQRRHLLFAICDHYEPLWGRADRKTGRARVRNWCVRYPEMAREFCDADGRPPRHSFFFPGEEYAPEYLDDLAELGAKGLGEVELHLHHDRDTKHALLEKIQLYLTSYARHGHLSREADGRLRYAFIHGNWCLANARPDGRWCGVDEEVALLFGSGCYADFTFPAAPDSSQPRIVNQIYWPVGDLSKKRAYEHGEPARVGQKKHDRILFVQGPLALAMRPHSFRPRIENSALTAHDPPTPARLQTWLRQRIGVRGRPDWIFVKVHTHGAPEAQAHAVLGEPIRRLHRELTTRYNDGVHWQLHYVTAREMYNIAIAAMDGKQGNPNAYRDYVLSPPPLERRARSWNADLSQLGE